MERTWSSSLAEDDGVYLALVAEDPYDLVNWQHRIYADDYANVNAIVDWIDYQYLIQWRWKLKQSKSYPGSKKIKKYLARTAHEGTRDDRVCCTVFMHTVIMERKGIPKPKTDKKLIVDHADSDELNCRRNNLRYATISFNNYNKYGSRQHVLIEEFA